MAKIQSDIWRLAASQLGPEPEPVGKSFNSFTLRLIPRRKPSPCYDSMGRTFFLIVTFPFWEPFFPTMEACALTIEELARVRNLKHGNRPLRESLWCTTIHRYKWSLGVMSSRLCDPLRTSIFQFYFTSWPCCRQVIMSASTLGHIQVALSANDGLRHSSGVRKRRFRH